MPDYKREQQITVRLQSEGERRGLRRLAELRAQSVSEAIRAGIRRALVERMHREEGTLRE